MITTKNPWNDILEKTYENKKVTVARDDWEHIKKILKLEKEKNVPKNEQLHLGLNPQQFIGNIKNANIIVLSKNPRYDKDFENLYNNNQDYQQACLDNLQLKENKVRFHAFDLDKGDKLGYWAERFKFWFEDAKASIELKTNKDFKEHEDWFSKHIALVEYFPYYSTKYNKQIATVIRNKGYLPTQQFLFELIKERIADESKPPVTILIVRAYAEWIEAIPEIKTYEKSYRSSNPRNATLRAQFLFKANKTSDEEEFTETLSELFKDLQHK